jgi:hypothetical protein
VLAREEDRPERLVAERLALDVSHPAKHPRLLDSLRSP